MKTTHEIARELLTWTDYQVPHSGYYKGAFLYIIGIEPEDGFLKLPHAATENALREIIAPVDMEQKQ